jgi:hypothetical protein
MVSFGAIILVLLAVGLILLYVKTRATDSTATPTEPTTTARAPTTTSRAPTTTTATAPRPLGCDAPERERVALSDISSVRQLVSGTWLLCDDVSAFGTEEAGLVIAPDGHWAKLDRDVDGQLTELDGRDNRGTWEVIDTSLMNGPGSFQINLNTLGGIAHGSPVVIIAPAKLLLDNMGQWSAAYVRADT